MEQILPDYTLLIQAAIFLVALYVIRAFIVNPISEVLQARRQHIEGAEQDAERFEQERMRLDEGYRTRISEARMQAQQERAQKREEALGEERRVLDQARLEAQKILEGIRGEIRKEQEAARVRLREDAVTLSRMLTEKLLGRPVS